MLDGIINDLMTDMIWVTILLLIPPVGIALVTGVTIGLLQAITSVQEQTLSFVPKLLAVGVILILMGGWMMRVITAYTIELMERMPEIGAL